jgi:hypothetical protein
LIYEAQFQRLSRRRNRASSLQPLRPIPKKQYPYPLRFGPGNSLKALFQSARTARIHSPVSGRSAAVRSPDVLRRLRAEYLVGDLFLLIRHRVVQVLERQNELLQLLPVRLGNVLIGLHVLDSIHRLVL